MELPQYSVKPVASRMIVPEFLKVFSLSLLFYVGIKLNFYFLEIKAGAWVDIAIIAFLALLSLTHVLQSHSKTAKEQYNFYANRIDRIGGKKPMQILFADVKNVTMSKNIFDNLFGTAKISLEPSMDMMYIKDATQIYYYIQKLIQNYRYSVYSQYYGPQQAMQQPQQQPQQQAQNQK